MKQISILFLIFTCTLIQAKSNKVIVSDTTEVVDENILYQVTHDTNNIFLNISTSDENMIMSILRRGLTIHFDIKGKENENVFIKYPYKVRSLGFKSTSNEERQQLGFKALIEKLPKEAEYVHFEDRQQFHIILNSLDISINVSTQEDGILIYNIRIPKSNISDDIKEDFSKLSIGIVAGKKEVSRSDNKVKLGNSSLGTRGGRGGGKGSGMQGGGNRKGNRGGTRKSPPASRPTTTTIDFWFDANLNN